MEQHRLTKNACYLTSGTMAIASNLSPLLFLTFRDMYNLSYTLLGLLIYVEEKFENVSVAVYALMAAGGDMGGCRCTTDGWNFF